MTRPILDVARDVLALDEKATPGPWTATTRQGSWDWLIAAKDPLEICQMFHDGTEFNEIGEANSQFVALTRTAAPALAREVLRQAWQPIETAPRGSDHPYGNDLENCSTWIIVWNGWHVGRAYGLVDGDAELHWIDECGEQIEPEPICWRLIDPPTPEEIERLKSGRE